MLVLSAEDVERLLDLDRLVDAVAAAMAELSTGGAVAPARAVVEVSGEDGLLLAMPAFLPAAGALTTKLVSLFPRNTDRPAVQGVICCFDPANGTPVAVMDGSVITAARTAAASALASRLLARRDARVVSILGTGVLARSHARALARHAGVEVIQIAGRDPARSAALAGELTGELAGIVPIVAGSMEDAVRSADIVCATTHSADPVVHRDWLRAGTHVNSVGHNPAGRGEVDLATVAEALVVVESRTAALAEAIEFRLARDAGLPAEGIVHAELGELVAGTRPGRAGDDQITLYKSVGHAVQAAAAAALVLERAFSSPGEGSPTVEA